MRALFGLGLLAVGCGAQPAPQASASAPPPARRETGTDWCEPEELFRAPVPPLPQADAACRQPEHDPRQLIAPYVPRIRLGPAETFLYLASCGDASRPKPTTGEGIPAWHGRPPACLAPSRRNVPRCSAGQIAGSLTVSSFLGDRRFRKGEAVRVRGRLWFSAVQSIPGKAHLGLAGDIGDPGTGCSRVFVRVPPNSPRPHLWRCEGQQGPDECCDARPERPPLGSMIVANGVIEDQISTESAQAWDVATLLSDTICVIQGSQ